MLLLEVGSANFPRTGRARDGARKAYAARDRPHGRAREPHEVVRVELDLEATAPRAHMDRLVLERRLVDRRRQRPPLAERRDAAEHVARRASPPCAPSAIATRFPNERRSTCDATGTIATASLPSRSTTSVLKTRAGSRPSASAASRPYDSAAGSCSYSCTEKRCPPAPPPRSPGSAPSLRRLDATVVAVVLLDLDDAPGGEAVVRDAPRAQRRPCRPRAGVDRELAAPAHARDDVSPLATWSRTS